MSCKVVEKERKSRGQKEGPVTVQMYLEGKEETYLTRTYVGR